VYPFKEISLAKYVLTIFLRDKWDKKDDFLLQKIEKERRRLGCMLPTATDKAVEIKTSITSG
jgi:hypothetical protein